MNTNRIEELVCRYWEGATSVEEEREIKAFFASADALPPKLEQWREWFAVVDAALPTGLGTDFDDALLSYAAKSQREAKLVRLKRTVLVSAAAVLTAVACLLPPALKQGDKLSAADMENYETVKELLLFTSAKLNQAESAVEAGFNAMDVMNEYVNIN